MSIYRVSGQFITLLALMLVFGLRIVHADETPPTLIAPADAARGVALPVTLQWKAVPFATEYECAVARDAKMADSALQYGMVAASSLPLSHLLPGTAYYWRVRAMHAQVPGPWSAVRTFTTADDVPVAARQGRMVLAMTGGDGAQVYMMNADGSGLTRVSSIGGVDMPALSPDGRYIAFIVNYNDLYISNADGSGCRRLCTIPGRTRAPNFSPDSRQVIFYLNENNADQHTCLINVDGTNLQRLPGSSNLQIDPAFNPDGTLLAVCLNHPITLRDAKTGKNVLELPNPDNVQYQEPCFSPDGAQLVSTAFVEKGMAVYLLNADGSGEIRLAFSTGVLSAPCFSPDGSRIAYVDKKLVKFLDPDGSHLAEYANPFGSYVNGFDWQPAAGRWAPEPPALQSPVDGATDQPVPTYAKWQALPGVTGYALQVADNDRFDKLIIDEQQLTGTQILLNDLKPGTRYWWRMRAHFRDAAGAWSRPDAFTTASVLPPALREPANDTSLVPITVNVRWEGAAGAEWYAMQVATDADFTRIVVDKDEVKGTSFLLDPLAAGTRYWWRVRTGGAKPGPWSLAYSFITTRTPAPVFFTPENFAKAVPTPLQLRWSAIPGAGVYQVQVASDDRMLLRLVNRYDLTTTALEAPALQPNTRYYCRVRAITGATSGPWSPLCIFETAATTQPPDQPVRHGRLLFCMAQNGGPCQLYSINADGTELRQLTNGPQSFRSSSFRQDGKVLAAMVSHGQEYGVCLLDPDGGNLRQLTPPELPTGNFRLRMVKFTPDGQHILVAEVNDSDRDRQASLWMLDSEGKSARKIPGSDAEIIEGFDFTPDGQRVIWNSFGQDMSMYSMRLDGTDKRRLYDKVTSSLAVTPDGQKLLFSWGGLWEMQIDGAELRQIFDGQLNSPTISPDGKQLAGVFMDIPGKEYVLGVMNRDGTGFTKILTKPWVAGFEIITPTWAPEPSAAK